MGGSASVNSPLEVNTAAKKWCSTEQEIEKVSYMWTISNLRYCISDHDKIFDSPVFSVGEKKTLWQLRIQTSTTNEIKIHTLNVFLKSAEEKKAKARFKFFIENSEQIKINFESKEVFTVAENNCSCFPCTLGDKFLINNKLPEDKVTIFCEIIVFGDRVNISGESNIEVPKCKLSEDLGKLLEDEQFTDVTLVADGHKFQAHKYILAARSAVFAAMFKHDFVELKLKIVDITDIPHESLKEMLHFIYTGKVPNLNETAKDLFKAADKYALEDLKTMCENALSGNLSVETAAETLILADFLKAEQLRAYTFAFINAHAIAVIQTPAWQEMTKTHPHLIAEGFQSFTSQLTNIPAV